MPISNSRLIPQEVLTSAQNWQIKTANYTAQSGDRIVANLTSSAWSLSLPANPAIGDEVQVLTFAAGSNALTVDPNGNNLNGANAAITITGDRLETRFVFVGASGWISAVGGGSSASPSPSPSPSPTPAVTAPVAGMAFWINGSLNDISGNNRHLSSSSTQYPVEILGMDDEPALAWNGNAGELTTAPFLGNATAATLYCVFSVSEGTGDYDLFRTNENQSFWRWSGNGNGFFGAFLNARMNDYPVSMPSTGNHLIVIFAKALTYEVQLDNVSKGVRDANFHAGNQIKICPSAYAFKGALSTSLLYSRQLTSAEHLQNLRYLKGRYPSLPFTLS